MYTWHTRKRHRRFQPTSGYLYVCERRLYRLGAPSSGAHAAWNVLSCSKPDYLNTPRGSALCYERRNELECTGLTRSTAAKCGGINSVQGYVFVGEFLHQSDYGTCVIDSIAFTAFYITPLRRRILLNRQHKSHYFLFCHRLRFNSH